MSYGPFAMAHRGLFRGPDPTRENTPEAIAEALANDYWVEADVWKVDDAWFLGHDRPEHRTTFKFLNQGRIYLHAKNFAAADALQAIQYDPKTRMSFFWHENDARVLTSNGLWWTYPNGQFNERSIIVCQDEIQFDLLKYYMEGTKIRPYAICYKKAEDVKAWNKQNQLI